MQIPELIKRARGIDPTLNIEIADSTFYTNTNVGKRNVIVLVSSLEREGSDEEMFLSMRDDEVLDVVVGQTTRHWQAAPFVKALRDGETRSVEA